MICPWYAWWPADFMASRTVVRMTREQRACYRELLDIAWIEDGLANDLAQLTADSDWPDEVALVLDRGFVLAEDGRWRNCRQEDEREIAATKHQARVKGGKTRGEQLRTLARAQGKDRSSLGAAKVEVSISPPEPTRADPSRPDTSDTPPPTPASGGADPTTPEAPQLTAPAPDTGGMVKWLTDSWNAATKTKAVRTVQEARAGLAECRLDPTMTDDRVKEAVTWWAAHRKDKFMPSLQLKFLARDLPKLEQARDRAASNNAKTPADREAAGIAARPLNQPEIANVR